MKRERFHGKWFLAPFEHLLHDGNLWGIRRRTVVPAFAIGLFFAFMPFPGHPVFAALAALAVRVNIPVAAVTTFVSNPLTMGPMYYLGFQIGEFLLGSGEGTFDFELSLAWVRDTFVTIWQPLMLGCVLLGTTFALLGYVGLDLLWRASIADYLTRKRARRGKD